MWSLKNWVKEKFMRGNGGWHQSYFTPKFPEKCINTQKKGKPPFARSSWETRMFNWCDLNQNVIQWGSEVLEVPYIFDIDKKVHRYYPDIWCKLKGKDGKTKTYLIEIKPKKQESKPKLPRNKTRKAMKNYNIALIEYIKNQNKWKYARIYCEGKNWQFKVLNETTLF